MVLVYDHQKKKKQKEKEQNNLKTEKKHRRVVVHDKSIYTNLVLEQSVLVLKFSWWT